MTLAPGGHTWELLGHARNALLLVHTGVLQALHPAVGSALVHQSTAFTDPWNRLWRSSYPILGSVYDEDADNTGRQIRGYHRDVRGVGPDGEPFHALNPGPFVWAHTTFMLSMVVSAQAFGRPLSEQQKQELWLEGVQWYSRYGVGLRDLPRDWPAAQAYVERTIREELTHVEAGALAIRSVSGRTPTLQGWFPQPVWDRIGPLVGRFEIWVATGLLDPILRDRLCLQWTRGDAARFAVLRRVVRVVMAAVPHDRRYLPQAAAGWRRARAAWVRNGQPANVG